MQALLRIDIQNNFLPGGAPAVADENTIISVCNALQPHFELAVATPDWQPAAL